MVVVISLLSIVSINAYDGQPLEVKQWKEAASAKVDDEEAVEANPFTYKKTWGIRDTFQGQHLKEWG